MDISRFKKLPIIGILRGIRPEVIEPIIESCLSAGLGTIEIAMNSAAAGKLIRSAVAKAKGRLMIGAGTVLSIDLLKEACDSGATFAVMPTLVDDVMEYCVKNVIPVFPGALTPSEVMRAWNAGASMVKIFPAKLFGPDYIRELKGPFGKIEVLACGGVTKHNISTYFSSGADAVAFGGGIFKSEWIDNGSFGDIASAISELIQNYGNQKG